MEEKATTMTQEEVDEEKGYLSDAFAVFFSVKSGIIPPTFKLDAIGYCLSAYNDLLNKFNKK